MGTTVLLSDTIILEGTTKYSFLPDILSRIDFPGRAFYISENRNSTSENDIHIRSNLEKMASFAPFSKFDYCFIDRSGEMGLINPDRMDQWRLICDSLQFPIRNIIYVSQNSKTINEVGPSYPRWMFLHHYAMAMASAHSDLNRDFNYGAGQSKFLLLNNKVRAHRIAILAALNASGASSRGLISWNNATPPGGDAHLRAQAKQDFPSFADAIDAWGGMKKVHFRQAIKPGSTEALVAEAEECFIEFVAETEYQRWSDRITEKSLRPAALHRPFIVFGVQGALKKFRELGFRTFAPVIDESYDEISDNNQRLCSALAALMSTLDRPQEIARELYDICAYNQQYLRKDLEPYLQARAKREIEILMQA